MYRPKNIIPKSQKLSLKIKKENKAASNIEIYVEENE